MRQILLLLALVALLTGCSSARKRAEEAVERCEYHRAASLYADLYRRTPSKRIELRGYYAWHTAEQYLRLRAYTRALMHYQQAERYGYPDSVLWLRLGMMHHASGQWAKAMNYYQRYQQTDPKSHLAKVGIEGCQQALTDTLTERRYEVRRSALGSASSDYAPAYSRDGRTLYVSSHRSRGGAERSEITGEAEGNIFTAQRSSLGVWAQRLDSLKGAVNTEHDEGTPALSGDGATLYYSYAEQSPKANRTAQIYRATKAGEAGWSKGQLLDVWRDSLTMAAHPSLSSSGRTLYFVSDAIGGYGGKDIYAVELEGNQMGVPRLLEMPINTPGHELYPHAVGDSTLYFASDGHPSYGGLDIYKATLLPSGLWSVAHLPQPINSFADDYGIAFDPTPMAGYMGGRLIERGMLSSTRDDGRGRPHLYDFALPAITTTIEGYVMDRSERTIAGATVRLVGNRAQQGRGHEQIATTRDDGSYRLEAEGDVEYIMLASAKGYLNQYARLRTDSLGHDEVYGVDFFLASRNEPEVLRQIYYAFDSSDLSPESESALGELVRILNDNPDIRITLSAHADRHGASDYNQHLSERRAESVVRYLVAQGIAPERLIATGYSWERPHTVRADEAERYPFVKAGDVLTPEFVEGLSPEEAAICDALNRRTEFAVDNP